MNLKLALMMVCIGSSALAQGGGGPPNSDIENIGSRDINRNQVNLVSLKKEIETGRQLSADVDSRVRLINDPVVNRYIDDLAQNIAANSDIQVPVSIKVVDSPDINISAIPGGFIYVNTGLIRTADNEAELAFAIAYAVADIAARHGAENATKGQLLNDANVPPVFLGGTAGMSIRQETGQWVPVAFYSFSRKAVAEDDFLAIQYLYKAGYDPEAAVTLLQKIQALELPMSPSSQSRLFATHPPTADRILAIQQNSARILPARGSSILTTATFAEIKTRIQ